jgi:hypothetical protein
MFYIIKAGHPTMPLLQDYSTEVSPKRFPDRRAQGFASAADRKDARFISSLTLKSAGGYHPSRLLKKSQAFRV